ncbi:MAG: AAA family ATPase [Candidatus Micrarchaeota archaeon]
MNIFDGKDDARVIANEKFLQPEFFPTQILNREKEINTIAYSVKSFLRSKSPQNLFVHGHPGTGKTTCASYVMNQLEEHTSAVTPLYLNCWKFSTSLSIYSEIATAMKLAIPRRGIAKDEVSQRIIEFLEKDKMRFVLVLDELDGLIKQGMDFLYFASRYPHFSIVGISNRTDFLALLDQRVKSSLNFSSLEFAKYSYLDLKFILAERAKNALVAGSYSDSIMDAIAKRSAETGDARFAIGLLLKSAKSAEQRNSNKIELVDVPRELIEHKFENKKLSDVEKEVVDFLKHGEKTSTEIYSHLSVKDISLSKRQIRTYLETLVEKGVIKQKEIETGSFLKPRMFSLS